MLHISCLQEILKQSRGPGGGFAWTGGGGRWPGPGIYCAEKKNHGSSRRETLAKSAGSCCLRSPEESASPTTTVNPRGIPRTINPLVSPFGVQSSAVQICNSKAWEAQLMDCLTKAGLVISLILEYSDYIKHARLQVLGWFSPTAVSHIAKPAWLGSQYLLRIGTGMSERCMHRIKRGFRYDPGTSVWVLVSVRTCSPMRESAAFWMKKLFNGFSCEFSVGKFTPFYVLLWSKRMSL